MHVKAPADETIDLRARTSWNHLHAVASRDAAGVLCWRLDPPTPSLRAIAEDRGRRAGEQLTGLPPDEVVRCAALLGWQVAEVMPVDETGVHLVFRRLAPT
ncbi:MAG: hypothetical protein JWN46_2878 [Acidimicrobiales bacterium]|nr:hypothetical protein [Acidimicrobiales bacterium]